MSDKEDTPFTDAAFDSDAVRKRKSKSPSLVEPKKSKAEEDPDTEDIAKQYKRFQNAPKFNLNSEELYCICRKPDNGTLMISCDGCEEWFHTRCMKIESLHLGLLDKFYCKFCQWKGKGTTRWLRKCRSPSCSKAARTSVQSKYCSEECGLAFLGAKLEGLRKFTKTDVNFVINYCGTHLDLERLGLQFPELQSVLLLDMAQFPPEVREMVVEIDNQYTALQTELQVVLRNKDYLQLIKSRNEVINERANLLVADGADADSTKKGKKKRAKLKKTDLCCFDAAVRNAVDTSVESAHHKLLEPKGTVYDKFQTEIDEALRMFETENLTGGAICLVDRRKCLRHNGWYNLLQDQVWKRLLELEDALERLKRRKDSALREYSISVYEKDQQGAQNMIPEVLAQTEV